MAWIPSHQEIGRHPKTILASEVFDLPIPYVVGHLHLFWHWCLDFAKNGSLRSCSPKSMAIGAQWPGDPQVFVDGLLEAGFIEYNDENDLVVHDWEQHGGKLLKKRESNTKSKQNYRQKNDVRTLSAGQASDKHRTSIGQEEMSTGQSIMSGRTVGHREEKRREEKNINNEEKKRAREPFDIDNPNDPRYHSAHYKALLKACSLTEVGLSMNPKRRAKVAGIAEQLARVYTIEQIGEARRRWPYPNPPTEEHFASEIDRLLAVNEVVSHARIRSPNSRSAERDKADAEIDSIIEANAFGG